MEGDAPPHIPACVFLEEKLGMKFYGLKKTLLLSYEPKIKIIAIGEENDLDTKTLFLLGATGSGKTSLINALVNHLLGVKFETNYRYVLNDEIGEDLKRPAESQTEYVVGYLIYAPPGFGRGHNYMIIDTPGFKDSRGKQRDQEITEQIRTFLQDVDGVDELHCIGFVVNGTIARLQEEFSDIVRTFCEVFGENAKGIIRILISFGYMRKPPVLKVLDCSCLKDYKRCKFDNVSLSVCNQPNEDYSDQEINMSKIIWNETAEVYDAMLREVESINAVSLGLTRDTLNAMENLHNSTESMKRAVVSYLDLMLGFKELEDKGREYQTVMRANENWQGTVEVKVRRRLRHLDWFARLRIHTHNCEKCVQTCRYPCVHLERSECPPSDQICDKCPCPNSSHVRSDDVITHQIENRPIIHEDKRAAYEEANRQKLELCEQMENVMKTAIEKKQEIIDILHGAVGFLKKIRENSLRIDLPTPQDFTEQFITEVKFEQLSININQQYQQGHVVPMLDDLQLNLNSIINSIDQ